MNQEIQLKQKWLKKLKNGIALFQQDDINYFRDYESCFVYPGFGILFE